VTLRVQIERAAETDMAEIVTYLQEQQPATALRFVRDIRKAFTFLAEHPEAGRKYETTHPLLQNLRIWRVKGFERYLIFYRVGQASLLIERVLYGGRDLEGILAGEE